jgi:hypothetical protein
LSSGDEQALVVHYLDELDRLHALKGSFVFSPSVPGSTEYLYPKQQRQDVVDFLLNCDTALDANSGILYSYLSDANPKKALMSGLFGVDLNAMSNVAGNLSEIPAKHMNESISDRVSYIKELIAPVPVVTEYDLMSLSGYSNDPNQSSFKAAFTTGLFDGLTTETETAWQTHVGLALNNYVVAHAYNFSDVDAILGGLTGAAARNVLADYVVVLGLTGSVTLSGQDDVEKRTKLHSQRVAQTQGYGLTMYEAGKTFSSTRIAQIAAAFLNLENLSLAALFFHDSYNVGNTNIISIFDALKKFSSFELWLYLGGTGISEQWAIDIAGQLGQMTNLSQLNLYLGNNSIGTTAQTTIRNALTSINLGVPQLMFLK